MKYTGSYGWCSWMAEIEEQRRQRVIRSLELQIVDKERELGCLREALAKASA